MADLTALKRKRSRIKANLTRHGTFINNYEPSKLCEVPIRLSKADELWVEFEKVQDETEKLCNDEDENNDMREQFQTSFFDIVGRLNMLGIKENTAQPEVQTSTAVSKPEVRLPAMELPTFYGSYKHWSEFLDTFNTLVDANPSLTDIQRFYYLKGALKGSAADVIHSLEVSSSNYKEAWALLRGRFENKKLISLSHIESMLNFPNMTRESHSDLRKFVDEVRRDFRALESLGLGADYWDPLLIYIFEGKLDSVTRKEWQKQSCVNTFATVEELLKFLANKCALLETNLRKQNEHSDKGKSSLRPSTPHTTLKVYSTQRGPRCLFCKSVDHYLQSCKKCIDTTVQGKREFITRSGLCWNCLRSGHRVQACTSGTCRHCKGKHHSLLHTDQGNRSETSDRQAADTDGDSRDDNDGSRTNTRAAFYGYRDELDMQGGEQVSEVLLSTAIIKLKDKKGDLHDCRALLDCGSQSSLMTREFRDRLDLPMKRTNISILGIGPDVTQITHSVRTTIYSTHTDYKVDTGFLVIDRISNTIPAMNIDISTLNIPNNLVLADASFGKIGKVDVLLGASIFWEILGSERISLGKNKPVIQYTKLGYVVAGQLSLGFGSGTRQSHVQTCNLASTISVQEQLERFWALEEVGYEKTRTKEEEDCESFFIETTERNQDGRFIVKLPFRTGTPQLGDSDMASKRFKAMEKKLGKDQESKELYHAFIQEYIDLGHMSVIEDVSQHDHGSSVYYLPHHPVLKKTSQTTKLRVVFDASATSSNGRSLNDHLMVGPKLQDDLIDILLRLRLHTVIITADVEKMFRQVSVATEDRDYQRILWRFNSNEPVSHYRLNTVTYGMASSGYLAVKCMQTFAEGMSDNSEASRIIIRDFYMDDLLTGAQTVEQAKILKEEISQLLAEGGFVLRKWKSNRPEVIATSGQPSVEHFISADNSTSKTLGIRWNAEHDTLNYDCPTEFGCCEIKVTKRQILSLVAQVFDPLGLVAPLVIRAKIILQSLWKEKLGWDEEVPQKVLVLWSRLQDEFKKLNEIQIGRQVICECPNEIQLHGFCDASEKAYGACIFIRSVDPLGNFHVHLLCSKSRVAPLKVISLPRLELCGALLLAKLTHAVFQSTALQPSAVRLWTDSSIVLCWLAEPSTWMTFVANRTSKVQHLTQGSHVSSEDNPADLVSRGADCYSLQLNSLWWKGPWWLSRHQEHWPHAERIDVKDVPDQRRVHQVFVGSNLSHFRKVFEFQ